MSDLPPVLTERQLWLGLFKVAVIIAVSLILGAFAVNALFGIDERFGQYGVSALLFAFSVSLLASGFLTILRIFDWFEARKIKTNG